MLTLKSSPKIIAKNENVIPIIIDEINPTIKFERLSLDGSCHSNITYMTQSDGSLLGTGLAEEHGDRQPNTPAGRQTDKPIEFPLIPTFHTNGGLWSCVRKDTCFFYFR